MKIIEWADGRIQKMNHWDIGALKILMLGIGMILGAWFPDFVLSHLGIFIPVLFVLFVRLIWKMFKPETK